MSAQSVGGDIRLSIGVRDHRKTGRLVSALGEAGAWSLVCLWTFAGDQHWDGDLTGLSDEDIEYEARWRGEPGAFVKALVRLRLLDGGEGHRHIHDWAEHQPFASQRGQRAEAARKAAKARWARVSGDSEPSREDAGRMRGACGADAGVMPPTQPNLRSTTKLQPDTSRASARDTVGSFEPDPEVPRESPPPSPAAPHAVALNRAGFRCTAMNPALLAFARDGGTVEHLLQVASLPECAGKAAGYVVAIARRELADQAAPVNGTALVATTSRRPSRQAEGLRALESLKSHNRRSRS